MNFFVKKLSQALNLTSISFHTSKVESNPFLKNGEVSNELNNVIIWMNPFRHNRNKDTTKFTDVRISKQRRLKILASQVEPPRHFRIQIQPESWTKISLEFRIFLVDDWATCEEIGPNQLPELVLSTRIARSSILWMTLVSPSWSKNCCRKTLKDRVHS